MLAALRSRPAAAALQCLAPGAAAGLQASLQRRGIASAPAVEGDALTVEVRRQWREMDSRAAQPSRGSLLTQRRYLAEHPWRLSAFACLLSEGPRRLPCLC